MLFHRQLSSSDGFKIRKKTDSASVKKNVSLKIVQTNLSYINDHHMQIFNEKFENDTTIVYKRNGNCLCEKYLGDDGKLWIDCLFDLIFNQRNYENKDF